MSATVTSAVHGHYLSRPRHERGTLSSLVPAMMVSAQLDLPDAFSTVTSIAKGRSASSSCHERRLLPALVPKMTLYAEANSKACAKRRGRSWAGRFLSNLCSNGFDAGNDATSQESHAAPAPRPEALLPAANITKDAGMQSHQSCAIEHGQLQRSVMRPRRHKVAPQDIDTDDWRPLFQQKCDEVVQKKGEGALTIRKLQELTWDAIIEHRLLKGK